MCVSLDAEPPWLQCPEDVVAGTDERRGTANVRWTVPTATDNSNEEVGFSKKFGPSKKVHFNIVGPLVTYSNVFYLPSTRWWCR